jgi:hypothetical protein
LIPYQLSVKDVEVDLLCKRDAFHYNLHRVNFHNDLILLKGISANLAAHSLLGADCVVAAEAEQLTLPSTLNLCAPTAPVPDSGHDPTVQLRV